MGVFLDTNVFIASLTDEPDRGDEATQVMNQDREFTTSQLYLMELLTVLTKKKRVEQTEAEDILTDIRDRVTVHDVDRSVMNQARDIQKEYLLYPMDAIVLASARIHEDLLVTFDSELLDAGAAPPHIALGKNDE